MNMTITVHDAFETVREAVEQALQQLRKEPHLFQNKTNERSITHQLAVCLRDKFEGWDVDCEYNRIGCDSETITKKILFLEQRQKTVKVDDLEGSRVFPDIIVHHRGKNEPGDNLLVIEVKTTWGDNDNSKDILKLKAFTGRSPVQQLVSYKYGLFLRFNERGAVVKNQEKHFERSAGNQSL
ncbi:MAG TPA: hypothetical protein VN966_02950 [Candidatus Bathyarchaeia archaeon]|nr:hypothetical protein [Candidatus Bathyarchaeia archaeon]